MYDVIKMQHAARKASPIGYCHVWKKRQKLGCRRCGMAAAKALGNNVRRPGAMVH